MTKVFNKVTFLNIILIFILFCLIIEPEVYMTSILNGVILWAKAVLPALFPFFFLSKMLTELGSVRYLSIAFEKPMRLLFNANGMCSYAFVMSIFSGYPVGAKVASELYENKLISKSDLYKSCTFCSTSGPLFIIGTIGVGMLFSKFYGVIILASHIIGAILNGVLWRNYKANDDSHISSSTINVQAYDNILSRTITNSVESVLVVGGFIALFCMFVDVGINTGLLQIVAQIISLPLKIFGININYSLALVTGIVEITRGSLEVSKVALSPSFMVILITFIISFGGISTHLQSFAFLGKNGVKYWFFLIAKVTQALISGIIAWLAMMLM